MVDTIGQCIVPLNTLTARYNIVPVYIQWASDIGDEDLAKRFPEAARYREAGINVLNPSA